MAEGTISDNTANAGGGVNVDNGAFTMSGGTISGNTAGGSSYGGGVYVDNGTFIMSGGTISDNTSFSGGGVHANFAGTFNMSGGTISDNTSVFGGGVFVVNNSAFTMSGGTISGNTAFSSDSSYTSSAYGGGVGVSGEGIFTMSGGTVSGNTAENGGGVYIQSGIFTKTGGTIYGDTDHIFGNGNATDNTATSTSNPGTNGHAVLNTVYNSSSYTDTYYYRNETLIDDLSGNISTTDTLPVESGDVLNSWTKR
jgi:hypothetical protein